MYCVFMMHDRLINEALADGCDMPGEISKIIWVRLAESLEWYFEIDKKSMNITLEK